jgi:hypothetical protein
MSTSPPIDLAQFARELGFDQIGYAPKTAFKLLDLGSTLGWRLIRDGELEAVKLTGKKTIITSVSMARLIHRRQQEPARQKRPRGNVIARRCKAQGS